MIFVIVAGVPVFRFTAGNPAELVLSSDTIQKVYYPETKPTILIFKRKRTQPNCVLPVGNGIIWLPQPIPCGTP